MNKFETWYLTYRNEITWWIIGWLTYAVIDCLITGNYLFAIIDAGLIYFNYYMWKRYAD